MKIDEFFFLITSPVGLTDTTLEVIVVSLAALFARPALNSIALLHFPGNLAPFSDV